MSDEVKPVAEVSPGEFSARFAWVTGAVAALVEGGVIWWTVALSADLGGRPRSEVARMDHATAQLLVVLVAFGGTLLVVGAWLAALETRGRLSLAKVSAPGDIRAKIGPGEVGDAIGTVVTSLSATRGTIAVLVSGLLILLLAGAGSVLLAHGAQTGAPRQANSAGASPTPGSGSG